MNELYLNGNVAILNYNQGYPVKGADILNSEAFKTVVQGYLKQANPLVIKWLDAYKREHSSLEDEIVACLREVYVTPLSQVQHPFIASHRMLLEVVEGLYTYWRSFQRCSIIYLSKRQKSELINFIERDGAFNRIVLNLYRFLQEKVQGRKNTVYRQLQAGTNAAITLVEKQSLLPEGYHHLKRIGMIDSVLFRSPLLLHPRNNKREGHFERASHNPLKGLKLSSKEFICFPAKVGKLLALIYFHKDFIFSGISLANLFELASTQEVKSRKPDIVVAFGVKDGSDDMVFYQDVANDLVVAKVAYDPKIEYFGYLKKITLTCSNVANMAKGRLPIHGAMVNITLQDKRKYGLVFMGDSGAGKSEIIEEITHLGGDAIDKIDVIFDDMGSLGMGVQTITAQGTEIGAFVRLDDLDRSLPYQAMDRSIFMNPESTVNARVIIPVNDYESIAQDHKVDFFFYANNYDDRFGLELFADITEHRDVFVQGKRMAKATTHEVGITTSYFANPFGPLQQQDQCDDLIDQYFAAFGRFGVKSGQVFTRLGVANRTQDDLKKTAQAVLDLLIEGEV